VAVTVTVPPVGIAPGAEKSVAPPLAVVEALNDPHAPVLPQVRLHVTPALAVSFATNAVNAAPVES
jgi:hypothetical protein